MHITYRTESEHIEYTIHVGYPPVWGDLDRCIFGPGALLDSHLPFFLSFCLLFIFFFLLVTETINF